MSGRCVIPWRFADDLLLLVLNEDSAGLASVLDARLHYALAAALLMDLSLEERIDVDTATNKLLLGVGHHFATGSQCQARWREMG